MALCDIGAMKQNKAKMGKRKKPLPPPRINGKDYEWVDTLKIEIIVGCADDDMVPSIGITPFLAFSYRRVKHNAWLLMHGNKVLMERGNPICWNDTILKTPMRPDVAIVNPQNKTYFTWSN